MKEADKLNGKISFGLILKYYIHRLWRITPPYMLVMLFATCLTQYLGNGPEYPFRDGFNPTCKDDWWKHLLYINNFFSPDAAVYSFIYTIHLLRLSLMGSFFCFLAKCLGVSWYLGVDMQLHLISPLLLIPFAIGYKFIGFLLSTALVVINIMLISVLILTDEGSERGVFS